MDGETFRESVRPYVSKPGEQVGSLEMTVSKLAPSLDDVLAENEKLKRRIAELEATLAARDANG